MRRLQSFWGPEVAHFWPLDSPLSMDLEVPFFRLKLGRTSTFSRFWLADLFKKNLRYKPLCSGDTDQKKWAWIGHTLRRGEDNITLMAMEWHPFDGLGRAPAGQCQTWRRAVKRETKILGKKLARAEITSQKPHTMASRDSWCPMSHRGLRTRRRYAVRAIGIFLPYCFGMQSRRTNKVLCCVGEFVARQLELISLLFATSIQKLLYFAIF